MKKLHKLVLLSYLGPFVMTFFIALFILLMQFLWKYIDDLVGKGLEGLIIAKLLFYTSATLVPLALPLAILLSSIMTFGNMAEHYELVACKSAGVSLQRAMQPLVILSILISGGAFYFSNVVLPYANLKSGSLLYDVQQKKPALNIRPGIFYNGIEGYSIRINEKDDEYDILKGLSIYDHTDNMGNTKVTVAETGTMRTTPDNRYLIITLKNGTSYEENRNLNKRGIDTHPQSRNSFKEQVVRLDLSGFKLNRTKEELFKENSQMMNLRQLSKMEDTLKKSVTTRIKEFKTNLFTYYGFKRDSSKLSINKNAVAVKSYINSLPANERLNTIEIALSQARNVKSYLSSSAEDIDIRQKVLNKNKVEWHIKFTLSIACLVLFFIGAPLGAIIRKGGLGMPVVVSTAFFLLFHILSITGKKLSVEGTWPVIMGMWMAPVVLLPIGIFLTYKATTDSTLFEREAYIKFFKKLVGKKA